MTSKPATWKEAKSSHRDNFPLDRGWAWSVMIGSFFNNLFFFLFVRSLSIFFIEFLNTFKQSATVTTLAFGLNTLAFSISSILVPPVLLSRFSVRTVSLVGALMNVSAIISMAFANNILHLNAMLILSGISSPFLFISQVTLLGDYFNKRLSFAVAVSNVGQSIALLTGPPFTRFLLDNYGLQGALLIHGALNLHNIAACLLFRPPSFYKRQNIEKLIKKESQDNESITDFNCNCDKSVNNKEGRNETRTFLQQDLSTTMEEILENSSCNDHIELEQTLLVRPTRKSINNSIMYIDVTNDTKLGNGDSITRSYDCNEIAVNENGGFSSLVSNYNHKEMKIGKKNVSEIEHQQSSDWVTELTKSEPSLAKKSNPMAFNYRSMFQLNMAFNYRSMFQLNNKPDESDLYQHSTNKLTKMDESKTDHLCSASFVEKPNPDNSSRRFLCNPTAIFLILISGLGVNTQCNSTYIPSLGKEHGLTDAQVPFLMTVIGASDFFKMLVGHLADKGWMPRIYIVIVHQILLGIVLQFSAYYDSFVSMIAFCIILGATTGLLHALLPGITTELLGKQYIGPVMSGYFVVNGINMTVTHIAIGYLKDSTGSFVAAYHLTGGLTLFTVVLILMDLTLRKMQEKRRRKEIISSL